MYKNRTRHIITIREYFEEKILEFLEPILPIKGTVAIFSDNFNVYDTGYLSTLFLK